jgi:hypothetical protein
VLICKQANGAGRVSGAINTILTHPTNSSIIYVGSVNGGVWKTENAHENNVNIHWRPLMNTSPVRSTGFNYIDSQYILQGSSVSFLAMAPFDPDFIAVGYGLVSSFHAHTEVYQ